MHAAVLWVNGDVERGLDTCVHCLVVQEEIAVSAGSVLAYHPVSGHLATRDVGNDSTEYDFSNSVELNYRHYVRAIYTRPTTVLLHHTYVTVGTRQLRLNVSNDHLDDVTALPSYELDVLEGINVTVIESAEYGVTNETVRFELAPQTGQCDTDRSV